MPINKKIQSLYDELKSGGADVGTAEEFNSWFLAKGKDGYENRKSVYDELKSGGADVGKNYEEFAGWLGLHAVKPQPTTSAQQVKPAQQAQQAKPKPQPKPKGTPLTDAEKAALDQWTKNMVAQGGAAIRRTKNAIDYAKARTFRVGGGGYGGKGNPNVATRHANGKITFGKPMIGADVQLPGDTYITESGNEYADRTGAEFEQGVTDNHKLLVAQYNSEMSLPQQIQRAEEEERRLGGLMRKRRDELDDKAKKHPFLTAVREMADESHGMPGGIVNDNGMRDYRQDDEYRQLEAAARKNRNTLQLLYDRRNNQTNDFWHNLGTTMLNGYTFTDGLSDTNDARSVMDAKKHIASINRKRQNGEPLTREEQTAEAVLNNFAANELANGMFGDQYGAWGRAGAMTANSIDFMKDIMLTGGGAQSIAKGIYKGVVKKGTKLLVKKGLETGVKSWIPKAVMKATGIGLGTTAAGTMITNTTGFGRVAGETAQGTAGHVGVDENGNYTIEDQQGLLHSFVEAERDMIGENQSEMFGEFLPGGGGLIKKGLEKIGLSKISGVLTNIGKKDWYQQYSKLLSAGGWNGLPGEAIEEYEGMLWDAMTGHGAEALEQLKDPRTHIDIWLGCATMGALLGAPSAIVQGQQTAQYYRYKHKTDASDKVAAFRMNTEGNDKWTPLRDKIDATDNANMADVVMNDIFGNMSLNAQEKMAALDYVRNLTRMRGYNIGEANNAGDVQENGSQSESASYGEGYNITDADAMNNARNTLMAAQQKLDAIFGEHTDARQILDARNEDGSSPFTQNDLAVAQSVADAQARRA